MNSNSGTTKYMSFKGSYTDYNGPPKVGFEALASPGQVITVSTSERFDSDHKPYSSNILQTNTGCKKQGQSGYTVSTYVPKQLSDARPIGRAHFKRTPSTGLTSQNNPVTTDTTFLHRSILNNQFLVPSANKAFAGTTDLRSSSKASGGPAQLTIFYAGSVCVYNDVSPEKAQAIMLLAGNGNSSSNPPKMTQCPTTPVTSEVEIKTPRPLYGANHFHSDNMLSNKRTSPVRLSTIPSSPIPISVSIPWHANVSNEPRKITFSSPISLSSQSSEGSADVIGSRPLASLTSSTRNPEPSKASTHISTITAVPQFRKASLARFLEKRKERAVMVGPYSNPTKQFPESE